MNDRQMRDWIAAGGGLVEWLASGERGVSSNQIVESLTGIQTDVEGWVFGGTHPSDPDDLMRCRKLLAAVPSLKAELPRMATVSREWAALVAEWDELCAMMDAEAPEWEHGKGIAPKTFSRMYDLIKQAQQGGEQCR